MLHLTELRADLPILPAHPSQVLLRVICSTASHPDYQSVLAVADLDHDSAQWTEPMHFPLSYRRPYLFEIFAKPSSPRQKSLPFLLHGEMHITPDLTKGSWPILDSEKHIVGNLWGSISVNPSKPLEGLTSLVIESVVCKRGDVGHLADKAIHSGFFTLKVGRTEASSEIVRTKAGDFIFIDQMNLLLQDATTQVTVSFFMFEPHTKGRSLIGTGVFDLSTDDKRMVLRRDSQDVGEVFLTWKLVRYGARQKTKFFSEMINESLNNTSRKSEFSEKANRLSSMLPQQANAIPRTKYQRRDSRSRSQHSSSPKRMSVIFGNGDIKFAQEPRFKSYEDPHNSAISYLAERSMEFRNGNLKGYYRGAGIGKGKKLDFCAVYEANPGVGRYRLPSIWDRY